MSKQRVLDEIRRTTVANGGKPLGFKRFGQETGIRYADWFGKYWKSWGDALREAGFQPNTLQGRIGDDDLLQRYVELVRELGRIPVRGDLLLKRRSDATFANAKVFDRFGSKKRLESKARDYCLAKGGFEDILPLLSADPNPVETQQRAQKSSGQVVGFVYLLKVGRHYKIGKTNSVGRRTRELEIQLPDKARTVHVINTDDPTGIEAYWHGRFASRRGNGEWFDLSQEDVAAFKRRTFQ